ncbi:MAG: hypothetical protein AB7T49_15235 [Oligoflexales bacterium]
MIKILFSVISVFFLVGCPEEDNHTPDKSKQRTIVAKPNPDYSITIHLDQEEKSIKVSLLDLPTTTTKVECQLSTLKITKCENGFEMKEPRDGNFILAIVINASLPTPLKYEVGFTVEKGQLKAPHIVITAHVMRTIDMKLVTDTFESHGAVVRSKPLVLEFLTENYSGCQHQFWCSYSEGLWSKCQLSDNKLEISPDEILRGFQKFAIKASCQEDSSRTSNVVELFWYGVDDGYLPLALSERKVGEYSHYSLQKQNDCVGKVHYQCRDQASYSFKNCLNVRKNPQVGFEIRAVCTGKDGETTGPSAVIQ